MKMEILRLTSGDGGEERHVRVAVARRGRRGRHASIANASESHARASSGEHRHRKLSVSGNQLVTRGAYKAQVKALTSVGEQNLWTTNHLMHYHQAGTRK